MISLEHLLTLFEHYKYLVILPIAIVEGPIIAVISGFIVSLGLANGYIIYILLLLGDLIGDSLHYALGRYGREKRWLGRIRDFFGYDDDVENFLQKHFEMHKGKTFIVAKVSHGLGGAVQVAAGMARVNYRQFFWWNFIGTLPKSLILMLIGYYAGHSYIKINTYLGVISLATIGIVVALIAGYILLAKFVKKHFSSVDRE